MATSVRMIRTMITSGGPLPALPLPSVARGNDAGDGVSEPGVVSATAAGVSDGVGVGLGVGLGVGDGVDVLDGAVTGASESCTGVGVGLAGAVTVTEPTPHVCGVGTQ